MKRDNVMSVADEKEKINLLSLGRGRKGNKKSLNKIKAKTSNVCI